MKRIEFKVTYAEGDEEVIAVFARTINSGARKALAIALTRRHGRKWNTRRWEFARIEFWQVTS